MLVMVAISIIIRFAQEMKSEVAAEALKGLVQTKVTVIRFYCAPGDRDPTPEDVEKMGTPIEQEVPIDDIVPGDIIKLSAGDMIPAGPSYHFFLSLLLFFFLSFL
jgi:Mg2+-importing ATPase